MALTFAAPPDSVKSVDIVVPQFDLFEAVPIAGEGGGGAPAPRSPDARSASSRRSRIFMPM